MSAGSIRIQKEDRDIKVLYSDFADTVSPSAIEEMSITTRVGPVIVGEVLDYKIENAVGEIAREDTRITIRVDADLAEGRDGRGPELQAAFEARAQAYNFPSGINYNAAGEQQENAELISATFQGFFIAMFCIFVILVLQFNSFRKPVVIMYSVICALL
ncbi:efflux RND transporter permease subunit [Patescibacteria group bacterium]|nr:efflux RND transporter permease subunit [Patescibacteria group bacterium]